MSKKPKRKRVRKVVAKTKWILEWWRPLGEFKNGERRMTQPGRFSKRRFVTKRTALKAKCANWKPPWKAFIYEKGKKPKKIIQIEINYSAE